MTSTTNGTAICIITANPDVTGIGIRASIYALAIGGRILQFIISQFTHPGSENYKEFKDAVDSALGIQGLALLCTAIFQTFHHALTLFHAICVIHLLALLGINVVSAGQYKGLGPFRLFTSIGISVLAGCAFIAFNVYVWITAPHFGSQVECNSSTIYVIFGVSIPATAPVFRYLILATLSIIPLAFLIFITFAIPCFAFFYYLFKKHPDVNTQVYSLPSSPAKQDNPKMKEFIGKLGILAFNIYAIVSLEQTIARNHVGAEEREWTFGQILPLFMLAGVLNEAVNLGLAALDRRRGWNGDGDGGGEGEGTELMEP